MLAFLDAIFLQPLMQIYADVLNALPASMSAGVRLILFSIIVNLVLTPVYLQMEKGSRRLNDIKEKVATDVARMRRHFRGRERYFYVRAVHRQYRYHPISALLGSADLFIQILVFATVYRYLSGLESLHGQSFGPITDLGQADGLLGGVNVLPFIMTAINAASVFAYVDDRRKRMQALALAAVFLVLLYGSPSGLVLYWTANNAFSWARNVVTRGSSIRWPARAAGWFAAMAGQR